VQLYRAAIAGRGWHGRVRAAGVVCALGATIADAGAQSLGALAALEEVRRAAIAAPARVYTNVPRTEQVTADVPELPVPAAAPPKVAAAPRASAAAQLKSEARYETAVVSVPRTVPDSLTAQPGTPAPHVNLPQPGRAADTTNTAAGSASAAPSINLTGWSAFEIKKTHAEMTETARLAADPQATAARTRSSDINLPPQRDVLRLSTGVGYLQGADWGGDISATGKVNGMQVDLNSFLTSGRKGFEARSGYVSIAGPDGKWRGEGGNLFSDLRGQASGARVSWSHGQTWTPSLSVYLRRVAGGTNSPTVLAYRDRLQLMPHVRVGGEVTSDGGAFVQGQYLRSRLDLTAFYRSTRSPIAGRDKGVSGGLTLGGGVGVSAAIRGSDAVGDSSLWRIASLRLPLARQASVTLERSFWNDASGDGSTNALMVQLPLGPVRLIQRIQWGRTDYRHRAVPFGFDRRQSQSSASYTPGPWGSLNYQQSTQFFDDGTVQEWDEVSSMFQLGRRTRAQFVTAFPNVSNSQRLRLRLTQRLSPTLELDAQYGRLSAFQLDRASAGEESRVLVTIRKTWQVESPARGGEVRGRAIDQAGYRVAGALVRLGPYSQLTDDAGEYRFTRLPEGPFALSLDKDALPAAFALDEKPRPLTVTRGSRELIDLQVIPLNAIRGRVYLDRNHNGHGDDGEGVANAVVGVNGSVTATSGTGDYAFYNQPPGRYRIRLDVKRLAKGLAPASPAEIDIELTPDYPLVGIDFTVEKKDMPIIMREIPK
jgi:hypothetical protein